MVGQKPDASSAKKPVLPLGEVLVGGQSKRTQPDAHLPVPKKAAVAPATSGIPTPVASTIDVPFSLSATAPGRATGAGHSVTLRRWAAETGEKLGAPSSRSLAPPPGFTSTSARLDALEWERRHEHHVVDVEKEITSVDGESLMSLAPLLDCHNAGLGTVNGSLMACAHCP